MIALASHPSEEPLKARALSAVRGGCRSRCRGSQGSGSLCLGLALLDALAHGQYGLANGCAHGLGSLDADVAACRHQPTEPAAADIGGLGRGLVFEHVHVDVQQGLDLARGINGQRSGGWLNGQRIGARHPRRKEVSLDVGP